VTCVPTMNPMNQSSLSSTFTSSETCQSNSENIPGSCPIDDYL
jgi:hypothetical protein